MNGMNEHQLILVLTYWLLHFPLEKIWFLIMKQLLFYFRSLESFLSFLIGCFIIFLQSPKRRELIYFRFPLIPSDKFMYRIYSENIMYIKLNTNVIPRDNRSEDFYQLAFLNINIQLYMHLARLVIIQRIYDKNNNSKDKIRLVLACIVFSN